MNTATDFPDPGMLEALRQLAAAEPFKPFTIRMASGVDFDIQKASDIQFTAFGTPKVYSEIDAFGQKLTWHLLNVDAITSITVHT